MREKDGMIYLDMKFSVKEEHWEALKRKFDRLGLGINEVLKQMLNNPKFIEYVKDNYRKFRFRTDLKEKETKVYLEKEVYQRIKELMKELRVTQKILTSMAIMYYVENQKEERPKKVQLDMTLEIKRPKNLK